MLGYIKADTQLILTQKLNGITIRVANTKTKKRRTFKEWLAYKLEGSRTSKHEYDLVVGSRWAIKNTSTSSQDAYSKTQVWKAVKDKYGHLIPRDVIVFGEVIGYLPGTTTPIMEGYTYSVPEGEIAFYVYRVAVVTDDQDLYDLSWDQVRDFCLRHHLKHVPELDRMPRAVLEPEKFENLNFRDEYEQHKHKGDVLYVDEPVGLGENDAPIDEGYVIRVESGLTPRILGRKSPKYFDYLRKQAH